MFPIDRDYKAPENDFESIEDGTYSIESIEFMDKSVDEATKKPKLTEGNFGPVVMFDLSIVGSDEDTIPLTCRLNEIPYMVQAFTGRAGETLPPVPALDQLAAIETYLILAVQLANEGTQRPTMVVKKGWGSVYRLANSGLPKGNYHGYFTDIVSKNSLGLPAPKSSPQFPDSYTYDALFLVVADQYGEPSGWTGVTYFQKFLPYKATTITDENGQVKADWIRGKKTNEYTKTAQQFSIFVVTTGPSLFPPSAEPRFADPANICPEWIIAAQRDRILLTFHIDTNDKGYRVIDIPGILPADPTRIKVQVVSPQIVPIVASSVTTTTPVSNGKSSQQSILRSEPTSVGPIIDDLPAKHILSLVELLNLLLTLREGENPLNEFHPSLLFVAPFPKLDQLDADQKIVIMTYVAPLKEHLSTPDLNRFTLTDVGRVFESLPFESFEDTFTARVATLFQKLETDKPTAATVENFF